MNTLTQAKSRRAGFTLIEVLAVILIIGILAGFLVTRLSGARTTVEMKTTSALLQQLATRIEEYAQDKGDYPRSTFPRDLDPKPSRTNMGGEMLLISLIPADGSYSAAVPEDQLCNTDGDDTKRSLTSFASSEVFEIADAWDNPIVYLHRRDYEDGADYVTFDGETGETVESRVTAAINPMTGNPYNSTKFQLLSAGPDGQFGTDDDIGNFRRADG